jgi:hypothetical protein
VIEKKIGIGIRIGGKLNRNRWVSDREKDRDRDRDRGKVEGVK